MSIKGHPLPPGGTIGVPSTGWTYHNRSEILRGVEWWEARGYRVKLASNVFARHGYVAGDPKERANGLMEMFADPDVDVVQSADAGFGSAHILEHIDFEVIRSNPKAFIGYSDITALHVAIRKETDLVTFHGPLLTNHGQKTSEEKDDEHMLAVLSTTDPIGELPPDPDDAYVRSFNGGKVTGELVGGNLWLMSHLMGTPWQPDFAGKILFFEDVTSPPWYIDAQLTQWRQAGMFEDILGIVIGDMQGVNWNNQEMHEWPQVVSIEDIFEEYIEPLGVPTIYGLPIGHGKHIWTIPLGVQVTLDGDARTLVFEEAGLESKGEGR
jgi:muramoyltetrapeptide carboxypeptidase